MREGTRLHKEIEDHLLQNKPLVSPELKYADILGVVPNFGAPMPFYVEAGIHRSDLEISGVPVRGFIDLIYMGEDGILTVRDWKFRSSLQYAPNEQELRTDPQAIIYSTAAFILAEKQYTHDAIRFEHCNIQRKNPDVKIVSFVWNKEEIAEAMKRIETAVSEMREMATREIENVPQSRSHCYKYRPACPFLNDCNKNPYIPGGMTMSIDDLFSTPKAPANENSEKIQALLDADLDPREFGFPEWQPPANNETDPKIQALLDKGLNPREFGYADYKPEASDAAAPNKAHDIVIDVLPPDASPDVYPNTTAAQTDVAETIAPLVEEGTPIESLGMGGRATNALKRNGLDTVEKLDAYLQGGGAIGELEGVGGKTAEEIQTAYMATKEAATPTPVETRIAPGQTLISVVAPGCAAYFKDRGIYTVEQILSASEEMKTREIADAESMGRKPDPNRSEIVYMFPEHIDLPDFQKLAVAISDVRTQLEKTEVSGVVRETKEVTIKFTADTSEVQKTIEKALSEERPELVLPEAAPTPKTIVLVDCVPTKGMICYNLEELLQDLKQNVLDEIGDERQHCGYFDFMDYNKGEKYLAVQVQKNLDRFIGKTIICNSRHPGHNRIVAILSGIADAVVQGV